MSPVLLEYAKQNSISSGFDELLQINFFESIRERRLEVFCSYGRKLDQNEWTCVIL